MLDRQHELNEIENMLKSGTEDLDMAFNMRGETPLEVAIKLGESKLITALIEAGVNINAEDIDGCTSLHLAAELGDHQAVLALIEAGANIDAINNFDRSPLDMAMDSGDSESVKHIINAKLNAGIDINQRLTNENATALHIAAFTNNPELIKDLIERGARVDVVDDDGFSPLEIAVMQADIKATKLLLKTNQYDLVTLVDAKGDTLLHKIRNEKSGELFKALLDSGANPFQPNIDGITACDLAIVKNNPVMLEEIIHSMNDVNAIINPEMDTVLTLAIKSNNTNMVKVVLDNHGNPSVYHTNEPPILLAAEIANYEIMKELISHGADVNITNNNNTTPLHRAAKTNNVDVAIVLINADANINAQNSDGRTPLHYAVIEESYDATSILLSLADTDVNIQDAKGCAPIHYAFQRGDSIAIQALTAAGADINLRDNNGQTLLHYAVNDGNIVVITELIQAGADVSIKDNQGNSPLQLAIERNIPNAATIFLHKGLAKPDTIDTIDDYINFTLNHKKDADEDGASLQARVIKFRMELVVKLADSKSSLTQALMKLPREDKIKMISALISNDIKYLEGVFKQPHYQTFLDEAGLKLSDLKYLTKHDNPKHSIQHDKWISPTTILMVNTLFRDGEGIPYSKQGQLALMTEAMAAIPDSQISLAAKYDLANDVSNNFESIRVAYNEFQQPLAGNKSSGVVTPSSYKNLMGLAKNELTQSDYILLTAGLLQPYADKHPDIALTLKTVRFLYAATEYQFSVEMLQVVAKSNENILGHELVDLIRTGATKFDHVDTENYGRRFFENRYAALHQNNTENLAAVNRILTHFGLDKAENNVEMIKQISLFCESDNDECYARMTELKKQSVYFQEVRRNYKSGFITKQDEMLDGKYSNSVYSRNTGVMASNQPNYYDELSLQALRNSPADIAVPNQSHPQHDVTKLGAFAAGVSGHTYFAIALLEKYARENIGSKTLEADINHFVESLMVTYINRGYHGMLEVQLPFQENHIIDNFEKNFGIKISTKYNDDVLKAALNDAQTYAETLGKRKLVGNEIVKKASTSTSTLFNANYRSKHAVKEPEYKDDDGGKIRNKK